MKKIIFGLALLLSSTAAFAQGGKLHVKGNLKGLSDTLLVLDDKVKDTVLVKNGSFDFNVDVKQPTKLAFVTPGTMRGTERQYFQLVAVPGETAELNGDIATRYDITGSKFYKEYHEADLMLESAQKEMSDFQASLSNRMKAGEKQEDLMKEYQAKMPEFTKKFNDAVFSFIKSHPDYEASAAIIPELEDIDDIKKCVAMLSDGVRNGRMKPVYEAPMKAMEAEKAAEEAAAKVQAAGVPATDFTLTDINGKPLTLSSFRGKYVLLDFWGSWCGWCIKGMPEMKKYYEKYKGKFEIIGVDCNDTQEKWKAAVEKNQLPWLHVYNKKGEGDVCKPYAIQGFPTKILIGPDGNIVKTVTGEDPAFYTFLDETFGK